MLEENVWRYIDNAGEKMEHVWSVEYTTISTLVKYSWDTLFELRNYGK